MSHLIRALLLLSLASPALAEDTDAPNESDDVRLPATALPAVCRDAVLAAWPGAEIRKVEADGADYEVGIRDAHGHLLELRVSADGRLLNQEQELERERGRERHERHERHEEQEEDDD